jgi:hypothetical protein
MQNLVRKKKPLSPPKKHAVRYKLEEKESVIIRTKWLEALKGPK